MPTLTIEDVCLDFGGVVALDHVGFEVFDREICGLIGPNGAGKTSLFNCINRMYEPSSGRILLDGVDLLGRRRHQVARFGMARTFQNLGLYTELDVLENVMLGAYHRSGTGFVSAVLGLRSARRMERQVRGEAMAVLDQLGMADLASHAVADIPYATAKRLEIARAVMSRPSLLLLDEPAGGLTHAEVDELAALIVRVRNENDVTILFVEHHMHMVMSISDRVVALNLGRKLAEGHPEDVRTDPEVVRAYLGDVA